MQSANLRSWIIWLTASLFYLFEFIHRVAISVMLPELALDLHASVSALGSLSACYFFAYASAQIPVGLLIDRFGTRSLLTIACLAIAVSSFIFAATTSIYLANVLRIVIGFGSAFAFVACLKLASIWFPARQFAFIVGLTNLFGVFGAILGGTPIAHSVDIFGWRYVMLGSGVIGLAIAVLLWIIIRDPKTGNGKSKPHVTLADFIPRLITTLKTSQIWIISAFGGLMVAPITTYSELWGTSFLMETYKFSRPFAAQITSLTFIGIAIGGPAIGYISDHLGRRKLPMLIGMLGALACITCILLEKNLSYGSLVLLHLGFGFFSSSMLLCFSLSSEAIVTDIRATTIALTNCVIMLMGANLQIISGNLLQYSYSFTIGLMPILACYALALICYKFIRETKCHFKDGDRALCS